MTSFHPIGKGLLIFIMLVVSICERPHHEPQWNDYIDALIDYSRDLKDHYHADRACIIGINGLRWNNQTNKYAFNLSPE